MRVENVPLLRKVLEHVTEHPLEHAQGHWAVRNGCGSAYCVAGWTAVFEGWTPTYEDDDVSTGTFVRAGSYHHAGDIARAALGVSDSDASVLFRSTNSLDVLWGLAETMTDGEIVRA